MTTIEERAHQYFYDLNSIARKIHQDIKVLQKNRTEIWNELDADKQEALLDQFFIDDSVRQKYAAAESADRSDSPVCFPKYVVNCGEKIVIDFDNDVSRPCQPGCTTDLGQRGIKRLGVGKGGGGTSRAVVTLKQIE